MKNVIKFGMELQAIILNKRLLEIILEQQAKNKKFEAKMDKIIKKEKR